jgi:hypothetical protein
MTLKSYIAIIFISLISIPVSAEDLLKGYSTEKPSHSMKCWTNGVWTTYDIIGDNIVVNKKAKVPISQNQGTIFAGKSIDKDVNGEPLNLVLIFDYPNRTVTQKINYIAEDVKHIRSEDRFDCN